MIDDAHFNEVYTALAAQLGMGAVGSPEHRRLLKEWRDSGQDADVMEFLFRNAKTTDMPITDD